MQKLKLAYFGTPDFAADFLQMIVEYKDLPVEVTCVVTQPDRPVGRKQLLTASPVKVRANEFKLKVVEGTKNLDFLSECDLALVFAFGEIISISILNLPKYGFWNIHPSSLPLYRGPTPVAAALINGDTQTGVTIIQLDPEMDHGPILGQEKLEILPNEKRPELTHRLTSLGFNLFSKCVDSLINGELNPVDQDHTKAIYTKLFKKEDGYVEMSKLKTQNSKLAREIFDKFRGLYPWPGIWTKVEVAGQEKRLKITDMDFIEGELVIKKVQLEGKNEVDFATFKKAYNFIF